MKRHPSCCFRATLLGSVAAAMLLALIAPPRQAAAQPSDPIFDSAVFMLRGSVTVDRRGRHSALLRALRHLEDPALKPLFQHAVDTGIPELQIHGLLGVAESSQPRKLSLTTLAEIKNQAVLQQVIGAGLDNELLDDEDAKQLLTWKDLDKKTKLVIAIRQVGDDGFTDKPLLRDIIANEKLLSAKAMAAMVLAQLGEPEGTQFLFGLNKHEDAKQRDEARAAVLLAADRFELDALAEWALAVATDPNAEKLSLLALRVALQYNANGARQEWQRRYEASADNIADRLRMALALLNLAGKVDTSLFGPIASDANPLIRQIGLTGQAVAAKQNVAAEVKTLLATRHPLASVWALHFAGKEAEKDAAIEILTTIINDYDDAPSRDKARALDRIIQAVEYLCEKDVDAASKVLRPLLTAEQADAKLHQAILFGLIQVNRGEPEKLVAGVTLADYKANALRLLVLAKADATLTRGDLQELGLLARGGGGLPESVRIQAGWEYLKRIGQEKAALAQAMRPQ